MAETFIIERRFNGPPDSGNGGYVCGLLGRKFEGPAEVSLRVPPPLETPLEYRETDDGIALYDGDQLVAEAKPASLELEVPQPPSMDEAEDAVQRYAGFESHVFPTCFVCGPEREPGDGMRIFSGPANGPDLVAAPWDVDPSLADENGVIAPEFYWAALDCTGAFSIKEQDGPAVLGRLTAEVDGSVTPGDRCIVMGWNLGRDGRKHFTATAIVAPDGFVIAKSKQIWIEMKT